MVRAVQTARARAGEVLAGAPLDDGDVDPRQRQLARQHQPRRTAAGDHHRMLGHRHPPASSVAVNGSPSTIASLSTKTHRSSARCLLHPFPL